MVKVIAKSIIKENEVESYLEVVEKLVNETRKEEGCIAYDLFQDINDERIFTLIEEWSSNEALDKHKESKHMLELRPIINQYRESVEITVYKKIF